MGGGGGEEGTIITLTLHGRMPSWRTLMWGAVAYLQYPAGHTIFCVACRPYGELVQALGLQGGVIVEGGTEAGLCVRGKKGER